MEGLEASELAQFTFEVFLTLSHEEQVCFFNKVKLLMREALQSISREEPGAVYHTALFWACFNMIMAIIKHDSRFEEYF